MILQEYDTLHEIFLKLKLVSELKKMLFWRLFLKCINKILKKNLQYQKVVEESWRNFNIKHTFAMLNKINEKKRREITKILITEKSELEDWNMYKV